MKGFVGVALAALLLAGSVESLSLQSGKDIDAHKCKTLCQRFGMKALAKKNAAFASVHDPTTCCKVCDEVYAAPSSLLQKTEPKAAPQPAAPVIAQRMCDMLLTFPASAAGGVQWQVLVQKYEERFGTRLDITALGHSSGVSFSPVSRTTFQF